MPTSRAEPRSLSLRAALERLCAGGIIIYPTETFYALGGSALAPEAAPAVYTAKGRERSLPLPLIIGSLEQLPLVASEVGPVELALMRAFWPGPLTLLLPAAGGLPPIVTGGNGKAAVRLCGHPAARRLCLAAGAPLISSSANRSGLPPARLPTELDQELLQHAELYQAGPLPTGGQPSTIVEAQGQSGALRLLRPGAVSADSLKAAGFTPAEQTST